MGPFHLFLVGLLFAGAVHAALPIGCPDLIARPDPARITVGALNVENLHDTVDDRNKDDEDFLPGPRVIPRQTGSRGKFRTYDWTRAKLQNKLANLQKLFGAFGHVDVLGAIELESEISTGYLAKTLGFDQFAMTRSPDERGMDVGTLYQESIGFSAKYLAEHNVSNAALKTRNILEVGFLVNGKHKLIVFTDHWPSQHNPTADRLEVARQLESIVSDRLKEYPDARIIALGDFNSLDKEQPNPFNDVLLKSRLLVDVEKLFRSDPTIDPALLASLPPSSYYYDRGKEWSHLDRMFVSQNALGGTGLALDLSSFRIVAPDFASRWIAGPKGRFKAPLRFDFDATTSGDTAGFSDHYGVKVDFVDRDLQPLPAAPGKP
jgi:hypothetical protein